MQQEHLPRIQFDGEHALLLENPYWVNEGVLLEELKMQTPTGFAIPAQRSPKYLRNTLEHLRCRFDRRYLTTLISRTLSGGGLSDLQVRTQEARVEVSGLLSREGRRTPFLVRGFLLEEAGSFGGVIFYDLRLFGHPGLPAPALISLLTARTGRHGPIHVSGAITLQFDLLSLLCRYGLSSSGWKIPSYRSVQLKQLEVIDDTISLLYNSQDAHTAFPLAQKDPLYPYWTELRQSEKMFFKAEDLIGKGDYKAALQIYSDELWRHPGHPFVQERLMQLYIACPQQEMWNKAYHIAEELLQQSHRSQSALNCLAQYFEGIQDYKTAAHYYTQLGESARKHKEHIEAALSFGKAAELLETLDAQQARQLWHMAREEDHAYRPAIAALARHALKTGEYKSAEEILRDLIAQTPPSIERARYHLSLAGLYRSRLRDLSNARQQLELAAPYLGEDIAYLRELAEFRLATDENIDALRILDRLTERVKLLNQPPLYADLLYRTGQILEERLGRPGQALSRYRETIRTRVNHGHANARIASLEAANIQEEPLLSGAFDDFNLLIEEKLRTLHSNTFSEKENAHLHLDISRLYWQYEKIDEAFQHGHDALKLSPSLEEAWELLEEISVQSSRQAELASIHRNLARSALFPHDAVQHLEKALRLHPNDTDTLRHLSQQYKKMEKWDKLDTLYTRWIEVAPAQETPSLWLQKAELQEKELQQLDGAERSYVQAFQVATDRLPFQKTLVSFYVRHKEWDKLDRQVDHVSQSLSEDEQAAIRAEKGRQLLKVHRKKQALQAFKRALDIKPNNPIYLKSTIDLMRQDTEAAQNETQLFIELLQRIADQTKQVETETEYRLELAKLLEQQNNTEAALREYQTTHQLVPTHKSALLSIARLSTVLLERSSAADAYENVLKLEDCTAEEQTNAYTQLILLYDVMQRERAVTRTVEQLLQQQSDFGSEETYGLPLPATLTSELKQARALFVLGHQHKQAGLMLQAIRSVQEEHPELISFILTSGIQLAPLHPQLWHYKLTHASEDERNTLWKELEQQATAERLSPSQMKQLDELFESLQYEGFQLEEIQSVFESFQAKQLFLAPLLQTYASMLEQQDQLERAVQVRLQLLEQLPTSPEKSNLRFELAIQQIRILNDREHGLEQLWLLLKEEPDHMDAFYELQQLYEEEEQLEGFIERIQTIAIEANPGAARADLCIQVFELARDLLGDEEKANLFFEQASQKPDPITLQVIAAAYEGAAQFQQAAELYARISTHDVPEMAVQALERAGELYQKELDEPDRAIEFFQQILEIEPTHEYAIEHLKQIYDMLWMWDDYATLLELQAEHAPSKVEASELYFEIGDIYLGRLEDYERALDLYRKSLRHNPSSIKALSSLQALYEELEEWPAVIAALKAQVRNEADPARLCDLHVQIAQLSLSRLSSPKETERHYQLAHTQQPSSVEPLEGLVALYQTTDDTEQIIHSAAQLAIVAVKNEDKSSGKDALKKMLSAVERTPGAQGPEALLRAVLQERQESAKLTRNVFDLLKEMSSVETLSPAFFLSKELYAQQLQELSWLLRVWDQEGEVLTEEQADTLMDHIEAQQWEELTGALNTLRNQTDIPEDQASYELAIAEVALYQRHAFEDAKQHAQEALKLGAPPERAMQILEALQLESKQQLHLGGLLALAKELTHPDELGRVLFHLGSIFLTQENGWSASLQCFVEACMLTPNPISLGESINHLYALNRALEEGKDLPSYPMNLPPLSVSILNAWTAFHHGNTLEAVRYLEEALSIETQYSPALRLLGHYYVNEGQNDDRAIHCFYTYLQREWEFLPFDEVVEVCLLLAQLYAKQSSWENALFYLEQSEKFIPEDARIFATQTAVLKQAGLWELLKDLYQKHIKQPEPTDNLADLWFHLGELQAVHLQNVEEAQLCYQRALQVDPLHTAALQELEELKQAQQRDDLSTSL